tara:strand:- start:244 stop:963 length:720 start_codon:yes stop_codon:yes gene_type:complete
MDLIILCGGKGTRLATITEGKQKCSLEVNGKPFILHIIDTIAKNFPIRSVCLCVGHASQDIISIDFSEYTNKGIEVRFSIETESLGTGGAVKQAIATKTFGPEIMICNGDSICDITNLRDEYILLPKTNTAGIIASASIAKSQRYGTLVVSNNKIKDFIEKKKNSTNGIINAGIYILNKMIIQELIKEKLEKNFSLEKDIFPYLVEIYDLYIASPTDTFIDIGIPEDFVRASNFIESKI